VQITISAPPFFILLFNNYGCVKTLLFAFQNIISVTPNLASFLVSKKIKKQDSDSPGVFLSKLCRKVDKFTDAKSAMKIISSREIYFCALNLLMSKNKYAAHSWKETSTDKHKIIEDTNQICARQVGGRKS
jgi:hypothetical protein